MILAPGILFRGAGIARSGLTCLALALIGAALFGLALRQFQRF